MDNNGSNSGKPVTSFRQKLKEQVERGVSNAEEIVKQQITKVPLFTTETFNPNEGKARVGRPRNPHKEEMAKAKADYKIKPPKVKDERVPATKPIDLGRLPNVVDANINKDKDKETIIPPTTALAVAEYDEQQVARCEKLMLKGMRDPKQLTDLLGSPSEAHTKAYIRRVYARWEITGSDGHLKRYRGEALSRLDLIEAELWKVSSETRDERTNVVAMQQLMALNKQRSEMLGLTPEVIERIVTITDEGNEVLARMNKQTKMVEMLSRFSELLVEGKNSAGKKLVKNAFSTPILQPLQSMPTEYTEVIESAKTIIDENKDKNMPENGQKE